MIRLHDELEETGQDGGILDHLQDSLRSNWKSFRKEFRRCRKKFSEKSVHQLRVETRRLLSLFDLLEPILPGPEVEKARRRFKKHLRRLAELRDAHVQALAIHREEPGFPAVRSLSGWLDKRERRLTKGNRKRMAAAGLDRFLEAITALQEQLRARCRQAGAIRRVSEAIPAALREAFQTTVRLEAAIDAAAPETIHRTRVAFKKFRYMVEALQPVLPWATDQHIAAMQTYQSMMGEIQDAEVLLLDLDELVKEKPELQKPLQAFQKELMRRRAARINRFLRHRRRLLDFWPQGRAPHRRAMPTQTSP